MRAVTIYICSLICAINCLAEPSLVPQDQQISDFELALQHARILAYKDENLAVAIDEYLALIKDHPNNDVLELELSKLYIRINKMDLALQSAKLVLAREPNNLEALVLFGKISAWLGENDQALLALNRANSKAPHRAEILRELARAQSIAKLYPEALDSYNKLLALGEAEHDLSIYKELANILFYTSDLEGALLNYAKTTPDLEVRKNSGLALSWLMRDEQALQLLEPLSKEIDFDREVELEKLRIYLRQEKLLLAKVALRKLLNSQHRDLEVLLEAVHLEIKLGQFIAAKNYYQEIIRDYELNDQKMQEYAGHISNWGDFYQAEKVYRDQLTKYPEDFELSLKLAQNLISQERYSEAEAIYLEKLYRHVDDKKILQELAALKLQEKDFQLALYYATKARENAAHASLDLSLQADAYIGLGELDLAKAAYRELYNDCCFKLRALLGLAKIARLEGELDLADSYLEQAIKLCPKNIEVIFSRTKPATLKTQAFMQTVLNSYSNEEIIKWVKLYLRANLNSSAIYLCRELLQKERDYFPAQLALAQTWASEFEYTKSANLYQKLVNAFPESRKLNIELARLLGWDRKFDAALRQYDLLIELNSFDPVPLREKARTLYWAKKPSPADKSYSKVNESNAKQEYQNFVALERKAKDLTWSKRPRQALEVYRDLVRCEPGNVEARFDLAQLYCSLSEPKQAISEYQGLLQIASSHNLATAALQKERARLDAEAFLSYSYWKEKGRGELSGIERHLASIALQSAQIQSTHISVRANTWAEKTDFDDKLVHAFGPSLGFDYRMDRDFKLEAQYTRKEYEDDQLGSRDLGSLSLWGNLTDYLSFSLSYERSDELYNLFSLQQGVEADNIRASLSSSLNHELELGLKSEFKNYTDNNHAWDLLPWVSYALSDQPKIFKIIFALQFKDTDKENIFISKDGELVDIIHPYWTPQSYSAAHLTFEWYHDLSSHLYCGNLLHFYDLKLSFKDDSEHNPGVELKAEWHNEFRKNWSVLASALVHESEEWDASGFWFNLAHTF